MSQPRSAANAGGVGCCVRSDAVAGRADAELRDELVALERIGNAVEARQAQLMVEIGARAQADDEARDAALSPAARVVVPDGRLTEFVVDEIAALLSCTRVAASHRYAAAVAAARHLELQAAWNRGDVGQRAVAEIASQVALLDDTGTVAERALDPLVREAIEYANGRTVPQLRSWLRRRVLAAAPEAAERRHARALADRRVTLTPVADGMAELWALLPATGALQARKSLDAIAAERAPDDRRSADQRRADALIDLLTGASTPPAIEVQVVIDADTLLVEGVAPSELVGYGPITAGQTHQLLNGSPDFDLIGRPFDAETQSCPPACDTNTWRRLVADPVTGFLTDVAEKKHRPSAALDRAVRARDLTCRFPGCRRPAVGQGTGVDLDHTTAWPEGETTATNLAALCRHHHRLKHHAGWKVQLDDVGQMRWTTPTGHTFVTYPWQYTSPQPTDPPPRALPDPAPPP